jgi:hypothetical protein
MAQVAANAEAEAEAGSGAGLGSARVGGGAGVGARRQSTGGTASGSSGSRPSRKASDPGMRSYRDEPYSTNLLPGEELVYDQTGRKTFLGAPAGKSMLRRVSSAIYIEGT